LQELDDAGVEFIVIGGVAATAHGSAHVTTDLDIVYRRTPENVALLADALSVLQPYLRGAPPGLPFQFGVDTIGRGLSVALVTRAPSADRNVDLELDVAGSIRPRTPRTISSGRRI